MAHAFLQTIDNKNPAKTSLQKSLKITQIKPGIKCTYLFQPHYSEPKCCFPKCANNDMNADTFTHTFGAKFTIGAAGNLHVASYYCSICCMHKVHVFGTRCVQQTDNQRTVVAFHISTALPD